MTVETPLSIDSQRIRCKHFDSRFLCFCKFEEQEYEPRREISDTWTPETYERFFAEVRAMLFQSTAPGNGVSEFFESYFEDPAFPHIRVRRLR